MHFLSKLWQKLFRSISRPARVSRPVLECLEDRLAPTVSLQLVVPPSSSYGVNNSLVIEYANTGSTNAPAPVVILSADNANLWLPTDPAITGPSLQLLATSPTGSAGTLAPGATGSIVVDFTATSSTASAVNFSLGQLTPGQTINWSALQSGMQPSTIPNANAWNAVFANFTANVGSTTDSYQAALDADATYLAQLGAPTNDVAQLVAYEINKANDAFSTSTLGDNVDAALPTPGSLSLSFERWFQPGVASRYQMGTLGLGWTNNWDITASTDSNGNVTINKSGALRYFTLQSDGSYLGILGDHGVLTALSGGGYQLTETDGSSTVFNANGTLDYVQDSNGNSITASYNTDGLLAQLTASNGAYLTLTYANELLTQVTDSTGEISTYTYDATGQYLLSSTDEFGTTTYTYVTGQGAAAQNALASIAFADNSHEYFSYDAEGRLIDAHQDNNQQDVKISYGAAGGYTATDADGNTSTVLLDDKGQVRETIDALGNVTRYTYDVSGELTAVNGPEGANYTYSYDLNGNLTSATDPLDLTTHFAYNANNDLTSYTDAGGNTTKYAYDSSNDLLSVTYANGTNEQTTYNPLGEATQYINANGAVISAAYNSQGLVTRESFADGSSYAYTYDVHGNLLTATGASGTITFKYQDNANPDLLTEVLYPNGQFLKFTYNTIGQRTQSVDQTGFTVNYTYDALGRLQELTDGNGNLIVQYIYDAAGNLIQQNNGNGTFTAYTYDGNDDVLSITNYGPSTGGTSYVSANSTVNSFDVYTYDALGNVLTDTNQDGQWVYVYDADSQLTGAVFTPNSSNPDGLTSQNLQYVYDAAGNRISQTVNGVTTTYVVNIVNEYTSSTTNGVTTNYQYDKDGNLINQTTGGSTTTYGYNELDQLTDVSGPGLTASYTYDPLGNRNSQTVNGTTTQFLIDPFGLGDVASTYSGSGSLIAHYTYGFGLTSQTSASGSSAYYDFNLTGNTIGITGAAGSYVNKYSYLPFGQTTTITATLANPFTFVGQFGVMQDGTNLIDMRAREYAPATGQFSSNDPLGIRGGDSNLRRYVLNNPIRAVDPAGLDEATPKDILDQSTAGAAEVLDGRKAIGAGEFEGLSNLLGVYGAGSGIASIYSDAGDILDHPTPAKNVVLAGDYTATVLGVAALLGAGPVVGAAGALIGAGLFIYKVTKAPEPAETQAPPGVIQLRAEEDVDLNNAIPATSAGNGTTDNTEPNVLIQLYGSYTLSSYAGVGFQENEVATMTAQVNGQADTNSGDFQAQIQWGDGASSTGDLVYEGTKGGAADYLIKGSHVYQTVGTNIPVMVTVTGPGGASVSFYPNDIDYADVAAMPSGIPGTQPSADANSMPPADVQIQLYGSYTITSYAGVGFQENDVATMQVQVNGQADTNPSDFQAQVNWGDSASWDSADLVYQGTNAGLADYLIKGSHVYQNAATSIPIVIYVTGPDGTSATFYTNDIDYADVAAMPSGIPGTQPSTGANSMAPADVQIQLYGSYTLTSYAGVGFQENDVATMQVQVNGQADTNPSDFQAQINWGDSASWDSADLVYQGTNAGLADYLIKASHVYQNPTTNIPIVIYVTGPDGTSATFYTNDIDYADVLAMPSGIPGTQPSTGGNSTAPADVQIQLYGSYTITSYAGVGFQENDVATMQVQVNGQADATLSDFAAQINWGDSAAWDSANLVYQGTNGSLADYLIKGSHVYAKTATGIPIVIYVTGPDGTSATFYANDFDYADVVAMPSGIPGTQPSAGGNSTPADVQIQLYGSYTITSYAGVGFQENDVATMQVQVNGQADTNPSDFQAQINWGDSAAWDSADLVYQGTNGGLADYLIKGSHVYLKPGTNIPIVIYVTGPDGTSTTFFANDIDYADVLANPNPIGLGSLSPTQWPQNQSGYAGAIAVNGGNGSYSNLVVTGLPPGLSASLSGSTIAISGTPTQSGTFGNIAVSLQDSSGDQGGGTFSLTIDAAISLSLSTVTVGAATLQAGSTTTVTLTVRDANGAQETSGGLTVAFGLGSGSSSGTFSSVTDNGNGTYTATFTGITAGTARTITATIDGSAVTSALPTITVTPGAADLSDSIVSVTPNSIASGSTATATLTAKDADGNQETGGGLTVTFGLGTGGSSGAFSSVTDNGNGTYTATFTGTTAGTARTITATIGGSAVTSTLPTITVTPGALSLSQSLVSITPTTIQSGNSATVTLTALDAAGNRETSGGLTVVFGVGAGTAEGTFGPVTYAGNGQYTATFTATTAGQNTLTATIGGLAVTSAAPSITVTAGTTVPGFSYNATTMVLIITGTATQNSFSFSQASSEDASGIVHTTYSFTLNGNSASYPDTALANVVVIAQGTSNTAILITNDTYLDNNGKTQETRETISLGSKTDAGVGTMQKYDANGNPYTFLTLSGFPISYAYVGRNDGTVSLYGSAGVAYNGFVSAGNYSYIAGPGLYHEAQGATSVYGYSAGQATDFAYQYTANPGSAFVVSGVAFSYMSCTDQNPNAKNVTQAYFNVGVGFLVNTGVSKNPGQDYAYIIDSPGNDTFIGGSADSYMYIQNGGGYAELDTAYAFALVYAESFVGGTDTAFNGDTSKNILGGAWHVE